MLYLLDFGHNLLSVSKLIEGSNVKVNFDMNGCIFQDHYTEERLGYGQRRPGHYKFHKAEARDEEKRQENKVEMFAGNAKVSLDKVKFN